MPTGRYNEPCQFCRFARVVLVGLCGGGLTGFLAMQYTQDVDWLSLWTFSGAIIPVLILVRKPRKNHFK